MFQRASITGVQESVLCKTQAPPQEHAPRSVHPAAQASHAHYSSTPQAGPLVADNVFDCGFKVAWFDVDDRQCTWLWFQGWLIWCWWQTMYLPVVSRLTDSMLVTDNVFDCGANVDWFDVGGRQCVWTWFQLQVSSISYIPACLG